MLMRRIQTDLSEGFFVWVLEFYNDVVARPGGGFDLACGSWKLL